MTLSPQHNPQHQTQGWGKLISPTCAHEQTLPHEDVSSHLQPTVIQSRPCRHERSPAPAAACQIQCRAAQPARSTQQNCVRTVPLGNRNKKQPVPRSQQAGRGSPLPSPLHPNLPRTAPAAPSETCPSCRSLPLSPREGRGSSSGPVNGGGEWRPFITPSPGRRKICQETHRSCVLAPSEVCWIVIANPVFPGSTHLSRQHIPTRVQSAGKEANGMTTPRAHISGLKNQCPSVWLCSSAQTQGCFILHTRGGIPLQLLCKQPPPNSSRDHAQELLVPTSLWMGMLPSSPGKGRCFPIQVS